MSSQYVGASVLAGAEELAALGRQLRVQSIRLADRAGSGHPTSSMSAADLVAVLIARHLRIDPSHPDAVASDRMVFSKGHASPLLYAALAALGMVTPEDLAAYRRLGGRLEGHPTPSVPGVDVATGSLGLGLPMGVGMAMAARCLDHTDSHIWVLCGDSEMAEGSMWEAIEHAGWLPLPNLTAIVDVNRLGQTGPTRHGWDLEPYRQRFEACGWIAACIDGHDVEAIDHALADSRYAGRPTAIIARTVKGSGAAETADVSGKHGKPLDDPQRAIDEIGDGAAVVVRPLTPEFRVEARRAFHPLQLPEWDVGDAQPTRAAFGAALVALARSRNDIVGLDGEVANSTGMEDFSEQFGDRFFQMYIAEQLMLSTAVGMQVTGWRPVVATFAAFLTRAHDVLRMASVSRARICVVGSHAGVSIGEDGPSQMGLEDIATMRGLAGSTVLYPCDANQTAALLAAAIDHVDVCYLRTTRGATPVIYEPGTEFPIGGSVLVRSSPHDDVTLVAAGVTLHEALTAADTLADAGIAARVLDVYSIKPIDGAALATAAQQTGRMVVVEDHRPEGGLGEAVLAALAEADVPIPVRHLAVRLLPGSATPEEQRRQAGIDAQSIVETALDLVPPRSQIAPG